MKDRTLSWKIRPYPSFLQIPYFHLFFTKFQPCSKRIRVNYIISPRPKWLPVENCPRILFAEGAALRVEAPCVHHYLSTRMWGMAWLDFTQPRFFIRFFLIFGWLVRWSVGWLVGWWSSWDLFEMVFSVQTSSSWVEAGEWSKHHVAGMQPPKSSWIYPSCLLECNCPLCRESRSSFRLSVSSSLISQIARN